MAQMDQAKMFWTYVYWGVGIGLCLLAGIWLIASRVEADVTKSAVLVQSEPMIDPHPTTKTEDAVLQQVEQVTLKAQQLVVDSPIQKKIDRLVTKRNSTELADNPWVVCIIQPDPSLEKKFLLITSSEAAGRAFNCYFGFYFNEQALMAKSDPILLVDRLFQESNRERVLSDKTYLESDVVEELDYWLYNLIDAEQSAAIREFVIACYQDDFANRLLESSGFQDSNWQKSTVISGLEVTYHAGRETYCTFEQT